MLENMLKTTETTELIKLLTHELQESVPIISETKKNSSQGKKDFKFRKQILLKVTNMNLNEQNDI